jgi:hypothetical protein
VLKLVPGPEMVLRVVLEMIRLVGMAGMVRGRELAPGPVFLSEVTIGCLDSAPVLDSQSLDLRLREQVETSLLALLDKPRSLVR